MVKEESFNSYTENEMAQNSTGPHANEHLTPLFFPVNMLEKVRKRRQAEHMI